MGAFGEVRGLLLPVSGERDPATWDRTPKVPSCFGKDVVSALAGATKCPGSSLPATRCLSDLAPEQENSG